MSSQADCAVTVEVLWRAEKGRISMGGSPALQRGTRLCWQPGDCEPAAEPTEGAAARGLALAVYAPEELSRGKSSSE
jgi:hypothetical protein